MVELLSVFEQKNKIKKSIWESFIISGLFLLFALILLLKEEDILNTLILSFGFLGIVFGVLLFPMYFKVPKDLRFYSNDFMKGIVFILFGGIAILKSDVLADMVTMVIGAYLIYKGAGRMQICLNFDDGASHYWKYLMCFSLCSMILGILILLNPFGDKFSLSTVLSICVIISESISIIQSIAILLGMRRVYDREEK